MGERGIETGVRWAAEEEEGEAAERRRGEGEGSANGRRKGHRSRSPVSPPATLRVLMD